MRRGEMRNERHGVAGGRGSEPVCATNRSPRSCGSTSISRISTSPSIVGTLRVWPSPIRTARAARFLPVGLSVGVAVSSASPSQRVAFQLQFFLGSRPPWPYPQVSCTSWIRLPHVSSSLAMIEPVVDVTGIVNSTPLAANRSCSACTSFTRNWVAGRS
jgi:hypothetical protein